MSRLDDHKVHIQKHFLHVFVALLQNANANANANARSRYNHGRRPMTILVQYLDQFWS